MENKLIKKAMPWLLIMLGFCLLDRLPLMSGLVFMNLGIVILIERKWPEKWGQES